MALNVSTDYPEGVVSFVLGDPVTDSPYAVFALGTHERITHYSLTCIAFANSTVWIESADGGIIYDVFFLNQFQNYKSAGAFSATDGLRIRYTGAAYIVIRGTIHYIT